MNQKILLKNGVWEIPDLYSSERIQDLHYSFWGLP